MKTKEQLTALVKKVCSEHAKGKLKSHASSGADKGLTNSLTNSWGPQMRV